MQKKKIYFLSFKKLLPTKESLFQKESMSIFLLRSCTLFSASSFFCLIVFFRKEIKKRNALRKSSFLSFLFPFFFYLPLFRFLLSLPFPSEVAMTFFFFYPFPEVISQESCFLVLSVGEELSLLSMWHRGRRRLGLLFDPMGAVVSPIISPKTNLIWFHAHQIHSWTTSTV